MPFKWKIKKTRHYNVLSRNVLVLSVELVDKTTLECTLSADSSGLDCLHNVCQRLSLQQPEFFGLRYMSKRPYPKVRWVELERPLKKQLEKYAQSPALTLAVQYYIHDVGLLQDEATRSHYFLQVKQDVLEGRLRCNYEQAVLLACYSLQADFGDHQPERHTPDYLKDFKLFPKQVVGEGEAGSLLEAVVWQYSSLTTLAQALAETYYILEAQRLPGYGQETFIAKDEKGCEVYLGASLLGIVVEPASGALQTFYRWNDITNLINHKRSFGIECSRSDETVHFVFEEPDAAKYVWKMCVKQHTFYKRNQDISEVFSGGMETRSLAIPDLQSSVLSSCPKPYMNTSASGHDMHKSCTILNESVCNEYNPKPYPSGLSHLENSFVANSADISSQATGLNSHYTTNDSISMNSPGVASNSCVTYTVKQNYTGVNQSLMPQCGQLQHDNLNHHVVYPSDMNLPTRVSIKKNQVPQYRSAPDYETALYQKYGPGVNQRLQPTMLYSSQPEISVLNKEKADGSTDKEAAMNVASQIPYNMYNAYNNVPNYSGLTPQHRLASPHQIGTLHSTYSTPELASEPVAATQNVAVDPMNYHFIHGSKPPPPYPYGKTNSNSTPDLASSTKNDQQNYKATRKQLSHMTSSLGCLVSPELSRTYENLSELTDVVESLRNELSKNESSFLHSFTPHHSTDNLDSIYQVQGIQRIKVNNPNVIASSYEPKPDVSEEPIYQNVNTLFVDANGAKRGRAKSAPQLDIDEVQMPDEARLRASSHNEAGQMVISHSGNIKVPVESSYPLPSQQVVINSKPVQPQFQKQIAQPQSHLVQVQRHLTAQNPSQPTVAQSPSQPWIVSSVVQHSHQPTHQTGPQHVPQQQIAYSKPNTAVLSVGSSQTSNVPKPLTVKNTPSPKLSQPSNPRMELKDSQFHVQTSATAMVISKKEVDLNSSLNFPVQSDPKVVELQQKVSSPEVVNEYEGIPLTKQAADFTSARRSENVSRNANRDVIPYEENRLKITPKKENKSGYINASHLTASVGVSQRFYICGQGPLLSTVTDFWQCVWEADVRLVIMLTALEGDSSAIKCFPYWPQTDGTSVECGQFRVYRKQSTKSGPQVTSRLQLVHMKHRKSRSVWHLQYTDWSDHDCPSDMRSFLGFLEELSTLRRVTFDEVTGIGTNRNTPVLVHCSDGAGRSGVVILSDLLMEASRHNLPLDPPKLLNHLRQQRQALIRTVSQYKFVYKVLISALQSTRLI